MPQQRPAITIHDSNSAFTLIELLVVITIIVVLLAMLTPALDKAIYQAELVVCAANQHTVTSGVQTYTMNNNRRYPARFHASADEQNYAARQPDALFNPVPISTPDKDLRNLIKDYFSINSALNDPLSQAVDLETSNESWIAESYNMFFGWQMTGPGVGGGGMLKLGDRWSYTNLPDDGITRRFKSVILDHDQSITEEETASSSHPDLDGTLTNKVWNSEFSPGGGSTVPTTIPGVANAEFIMSKWRGFYTRGDIDMNAGMADGSVERFNSVPWDAGMPDPERPGSTVDPRFSRIPRASQSSNYNHSFHNVPIR